MDKNGKTVVNKIDRPRYPNVRCMRPGHADEPGYVVCKHVRAGAMIAKYSPATATALGVITCSVEHRSKDLSLCCAHCARTNGWAPKELVQ